MRSSAIVVLSIWLASGCGSAPAAPSPDQSPLNRAQPVPPAVPVTSHSFFGTVTNEEGSPISGAVVTVTYVPDIGAAQSTNTVTGSDGRYDLRLNVSEPGNVNALIRGSAGGEYLPNEQLVRLAPTAERNLRLRRVRTIGVGQSTAISFDADSSRCTAPRTEGICEVVRIQFPSEWVARLVVKVTPEGDGIVPTVLANYGLPPISGPGAISIPIGDNDFWDPRVPRFLDVAIFVAGADTPQRYEVSLYAAP